MEPITIAEIEYASRVLFKGDSTKFFDDIENKTGERVEAIQCIESKPIVACPGSGKTTVLLAKLIILANRLPFEDGRGICVLTHTNVAIDLIKKKLGAEAFKLFAYPNFFGTIQSFVDKFLAIPFNASKSEKRLRPQIDNDYYCAKIDSHRRYLGKNANRFCNVNQMKGYPRSITWDDLIVDNQNVCQSLKLDLKVAEQEQIYSKLKKMKYEINGNGVLSFDDAYFIANKYINALPQIKEAFQERFKFVFIDEMQDTASHQSIIINMLFKESEKTIIQEFGDPNQSIYDYDGQKGEWIYDENNCLHLSKSKRFGNQLADIINPLRVKDNEIPIEGENQDSTLTPHLIIFDEANIKILEKFGKLIVGNGLHTYKESKFVAIGRVGKEKEEGKITLKTYWEGFEKESAKIKEYFPTLIEYFSKEFPRNKFNYTERITNAILHLIDIHEFKNEIVFNGRLIQKRFTKTTLFEYLKKQSDNIYFEFRMLITDCGYLIRKGNMNFNTEVYSEIVKFISDRILSIRNIQLNSEHEFLQIPQNIVARNQKEKQTNIFSYTDELGNVVPIKINTIHGEKGETHTATLYLETYKNDSYDSILIKRQLEGKSFKKSYNETASKIAYVAMSRSEKLLCFAVSSSRISEEYAKSNIEPRGWKIETIA